MQSFNIVKTIDKKESFRVEKLIGMFDLHPENLTQRFVGNFALPDSWNIGVIVGRSGTGKSTIAREIYKDSYWHDALIPTPVGEAMPVIDLMPQGKTVEEITKTFTEVGFSSPPSWLKPYAVLSNGEKMRVDLAYSLLSGKNPIIFDEFTSVVDRDVAKICSMVVQKEVRKQNKQFVAVTCHYDVLEFLEPDWVFSTDEMKMIDVKKKREPIEISIYRGDTSYWRMFEKYHYMSSDLNQTARVFVATLWGKVVGFIAVLHFPHPSVKNMKKISRVVVLPDYQGIGIGKQLLNFVGEYYTKRGFRMTITTSHPAFNKTLRSPWHLIRQSRVKGIGQTGQVALGKTVTANRITCSWEYRA
jgi:GNAT superfamily N-acetyltransferase/alpha-D-ribose 1-methylphosphonate 5-triphosphate synthase subunit PhnL